MRKNFFQKRKKGRYVFGNSTFEWNVMAIYFYGTVASSVHTNCYHNKESVFHYHHSYGLLQINARHPRIEKLETDKDKYLLPLTTIS